MIATMTGQQYRAAFAARATKDVRYYLVGIFIHAENAEVVATDGSIMYYASIERGDGNIEAIIFEPAKIAPSALRVTVEAFDKHNVLVKTYHRSDRATGQHICKIIAGRYPDYQQIIPKSGQAGGPGEAFSFHTKYLALLKTIFGATPVRFTMADPNQAALITTAKPEQGTLLMLPCRL